MLNQVKGAVRAGKGHLKQAAGELTDDQVLRGEGEFDIASGRAQRGLDKAVEPLRRLARSTPVRALLVAMAAGLLLGHLRAARGDDE